MQFSKAWTCVNMEHVSDLAEAPVQKPNWDSITQGHLLLFCWLQESAIVCGGRTRSADRPCGQQMWSAAFRITKIKGWIEWSDSVRGAGRRRCELKYWQNVCSCGVLKWRIKRWSAEGDQRLASAVRLSDRATDRPTDRLTKRSVKCLVFMGF
jgi:hypothetical protein